MKIVSDVYSEIGKAVVNTGLGLILASTIAWLFKKSRLPGGRLLLE